MTQTDKYSAIDLKKIKIRLPFGVGVVHFVGIGGIGMSGIAEVMHNLGYEVRGSDVADSANVQRLRDKGIPIVIGHKPEHVEGAEAVIISTAIKAGNPEVAAARAWQIEDSAVDIDDVTIGGCHPLEVGRQHHPEDQSVEVDWGVGLGHDVIHNRLAVTRIFGASEFDCASVAPSKDRVGQAPGRLIC